MNLKTNLGKLRLIGIAEGISLLILLCIAMPIKYIAGNPYPVKIIGWMHGFLFILFLAAVLVVYFEKHWPFKRLVAACVAAFLPFGTFVFDRVIRKEDTGA